MKLLRLLLVFAAHISFEQALRDSKNILVILLLLVKQVYLTVHLVLHFADLFLVDLLRFEVLLGQLVVDLLKE